MALDAFVSSDFYMRDIYFDLIQHAIIWGLFLIYPAEIECFIPKNSYVEA